MSDKTVAEMRVKVGLLYYELYYGLYTKTYSVHCRLLMAYILTSFHVCVGLKADMIFDSVVSALVDEDDRFVHPQTEGVAQSTCNT